MYTASDEILRKPVFFLATITLPVEINTHLCLKVNSSSSRDNRNVIDATYCDTCDSEFNLDRTRTEPTDDKTATQTDL